MLQRAREAVELVPFSTAAALVGAAGLALSLLLWRPTSRRLGWAPVPTLVAMLALSAVGALTLGPGRTSAPGGVRACVRSAPRQLDRTVTTAVVPTETLLNAVMLLPLGVALVLAARRLLPAVVVLLVVPGAVEVVQTRIPGRTCSGVDYVTNLGGGLAGALLGLVVLLAARGRRGPGSR